MAGAMSDETPISEPIQSALNTVKAERGGLEALEVALADGMGEPFRRAVDTLGGIGGRVIVTGVGKSGHIGSKIAATFASTGTPAFFVHPAEANHGDLGMIARDDAILAMSWSGESGELRGIIAYSQRFSIPLIAITAGAQSTLAKDADIVLVLPKAAEACPHGLAPTTSTVMQLALGDALAIALLESRGFSASDFHVFHPGGKLGAQLTLVGNVMHSGERMPVVGLGTSMREAILEATSKGFGCVAVTDAAGLLTGIITDGDLRRHMGGDLLAQTVDAVMTPGPKSVAPDTLCGRALQVLNESRITTVMVTDRDNRPVGIVHMHDLLRIGAA
ncbi:MAG: KpsF/GutQ family sugar-phosphate isomerase [Brucellaceae bacterium]|nr:KpsF/GutQ family sugar-phosphate isomerase [Brucellaceae bacterium]